MGVCHYPLHLPGPLRLPSFPYLPWRKCTLAPHLLPAMGEVHSEEERLILAWDVLRRDHQQVADAGGPRRLQLGSLGGGAEPD